jgi:hypothetical protein
MNRDAGLLIIFIVRATSRARRKRPSVWLPLSSNYTTLSLLGTRFQIPPQPQRFSFSGVKV